MAIFAISFRISDEETINGSRKERYDSFVAAVKTESALEYVWEETTSFILIRNDNDSSKTLVNAFASLSVFDPDVDLAVVINLSRKGHTVMGHPLDDDIEKLMAMR